MINRLVLSRFTMAAVTLAAFLFVSSGAFAQPVAGCNPRVLDAMQKKAQAKVAADVAMTESITDKPDSVLAMTCFNRAAGTSANHGGAIFSGDFTTGLAPIIENALTAFFDDFRDGAGFEAFLAGLPTAIDYTQTTLDNTQDCNDVKNLWSTIKEQGIQAGIPFASLTNLISGATPGGTIPGDEFIDNWTRNAGDNIFADLANAFALMPQPAIAPLAANQTACQVLQAIGSLPAGPCP